MLPRAEPGEIHPGGNRLPGIVAAIPRHGMRTFGKSAGNERPDPLAGDGVDRKFDLSGLRIERDGNAGGRSLSPN